MSMFPTDVVPPAAPAVKVPWTFYLQRARFFARRWWWVVAITIMLALIYQDYQQHRRVPLYFSTSRMIMNGHVSLPQSDLYSVDADNFYGTQVALMESPSTLTQSVEKVTASHPEVSSDSGATVEANEEARTSIFNLKVTSNNAAYSRLLLNAVMDTYLDDKRGRKNQTTDEAMSAISARISELEIAIKADGQEILDFQKNNDVIFIEEQSKNSADNLVHLNDELAHLLKERDLLALEDKDTVLTKDESKLLASDVARPVAEAAVANTNVVVPQSLDGHPQDYNNPLVLEQDKLEKLKITYSELLVYLKVNHPKMLDLKDQIDQQTQYLSVLQDRSASAREARGEELKLQIENLRKQIELANQTSLKLSESLATFTQIKDKLAREQGLYSQLSQSIQNVDFNKSLDQENLGILEAASEARPMIYNPFVKLIESGLQGLALGLVLVFGISRLDDRVTSPVELNKHFRFPLLGQIPLVDVDKETKNAPLIMQDDKRNEYVEFYRDLRGGVLFQIPEGKGSLMVTSATPGEGKSSVSANLAISLAHSGIKVLLIDADMRKGVLHEIFGAPAAKVQGFSSYLRGEARLADLILPTSEKGLDLILRGEVLLNAGDMLTPHLVAALLAEALQSYDLVIFDTPPLLAAHDAIDLCSKVSGVLFIARVGVTSLRDMRTALTALEEKKARIIGLVLNALAPDDSSIGKYYRYKGYAYSPVEVPEERVPAEV